MALATGRVLGSALGGGMGLCVGASRGPWASVLGGGTDPRVRVLGAGKVLGAGSALGGGTEVRGRTLGAASAGAGAGGLGERAPTPGVLGIAEPEPRCGRGLGGRIVGPLESLSVAG